MDTADVCSFGHQLVPGSDSITLKTIDPATGRLLKEEKRLLRRHLAVGTESVFDPTGLVPAQCPHGLRVRRDGRYTEKADGPFLLLDGDAQLPPRAGQTWMRARVLTVHNVGMVNLIKCPVCLGEPGSMDMILPADGSFTPAPEDLPEWAQ